MIISLVGALPASTSYNFVCVEQAKSGGDVVSGIQNILKTN